MTWKDVQKGCMVTREWAFFSEHPANCNSIQMKKQNSTLPALTVMQMQALFQELVLVLTCKA